MRKLLQIGEVAQLLGVSTKTIRHYHKIGLLQEPERSQAGYRLYDTQELLRLKQVRHLQSLGLPLKQIKRLLGAPTQEHTLHEILQQLDQELAEQVHQLEARRTRIQELLSEPATLQTLDAFDIAATLEWVRGILGEHAEHFSTQAIHMEARLWAAIRNFAWPTAFREQMQQLMHEAAARPENYARAIRFYDRLTLLDTLQEDDPEVLRLAQDCMQDNEFLTFFHEIQGMMTQIPPLPAPFSEVFAELLSVHLSPTQLRFFTELERLRSSAIQTTNPL